MRQYLDTCRHVLTRGKSHRDRTGVGTIRVFGHQVRFDLRDGFPLLTTKKMFTKGVIAELLWILSGDTNVKKLQEQGVHIWDEWADEKGNLGPVYGEQWRRWLNHHDGFSSDPAKAFVDQIANLVDTIKNNPNSRRMIVTAWQPADIELMALPPCHCFFQCMVDSGKLSLQLYQRSADLFLGVPFNIASYALLTHMLAHVCNLEVGEFIHTFGDLHIYSNHQKQVMKQLGRQPYQLPRLKIKRKVTSIDDFKLEDFEIEGYQHHPAIKAEVAV